MKNLTKKQIAKLNDLVNNGKYIGTSVVSISKGKNKMVVEMVAHTLQSTNTLYVLLDEHLQFISINGSHELPDNLKGFVSIK